MTQNEVAGSWHQNHAIFPAHPRRKQVWPLSAGARTTGSAAQSAFTFRCGTCGVSAERRNAHASGGLHDRLQLGFVLTYFFPFFIVFASFTASATPFSAAVFFTLALSAPVSDFRAPRYCPCSFLAPRAFGESFASYHPETRRRGSRGLPMVVVQHATKA
jgi:hypothetical protein